MSLHKSAPVDPCQRPTRFASGEKKATKTCQHAKWGVRWLFYWHYFLEMTTWSFHFFFGFLGCFEKKWSLKVRWIWKVKTTEFAKTSHDPYHIFIVCFWRLTYPRQVMIPITTSFIMCSIIQLFCFCFNKPSGLYFAPKSANCSLLRLIYGLSQLWNSGTQPPKSSCPRGN